MTPKLFLYALLFVALFGLIHTAPIQDPNGGGTGERSLSLNSSSPYSGFYPGFLKGMQAATKPVSAAVQNIGAAAQQAGVAGAKIAGDAAVGAGKSCSQIPKRFYQLLKALEKKGIAATVLKILFGKEPIKKKKQPKKPRNSKA